MARKIEAAIGGLILQDQTDPITSNNNILECLPCQEATVTFKNVHNTLLTIDQIIFDAVVGSGWSLSYTAINGGASTLPFNVAAGDDFTVTIQVCRDPNFIAAGILGLRFNTTQHNLEDWFSIPVAGVTFDSLISVALIDYGNVPVGLPQTQGVTITNNTIAPIDYQISICAPLTGFNLSNSVPVNGSQTATINWTPSSFPESLYCLATAEETNSATNCSTKIEIYGEAANYDCDPEGGICCLNVILNTEQNYLNSIDQLCEEAAPLGSSAILEKKQLIYDFKYANPIVGGFKVYFNPILFSSTGTEWDAIVANPSTPPTTAWYKEWLPTFVQGSPYQMSPVNFGTASGSQRNISAFLTVIDDVNGIFRITFDFYMISDYQLPINTAAFNNQFKYSKSRYLNPTEFDNSQSCVYNDDKKITSLIYVLDTNFQPGGLKKAISHSLNYTSRFYNKGLYDGLSEFTSPTWTLSRSNGLVNSLSIFEQTKVTFNITIDSGLYTGAEAIIFHMIDRNYNVITGTTITAVDGSRSLIQNLPAGSGVLNNHFILPSTFLNVSGDIWEASCYIDTNLDLTHQYMIFAVVYAQDGVTVNTFKSQQYSVRATPEYDCDCVPEIESHWDNYFETRQTDDYRPVGKERIKHRLVLNQGALGDCIENWGIEVEDWRKLLTQVNLRIYKRQLYFPADPNQDYATFFEYGNYTSVRNNSFLYGWQNFGALSVSDENIDEIHLSINNIRVPWESTTFNGNVTQCKMDTYMDKYPILAPTSTNYINALNVVNSWIDENVYFEYEFVFDLSAYFPEAFTFSICRAFMVSAISFENVNSGFPPHIINFQFEGYDPTISTWVPLPSLVNALSYSQLRLIYTSDDVAPYIGWFNFFIEELPFGLPTLIESNATASPNGLQNYGLANIVDTQFIQYTASPTPPYEAHVYIDTSKLKTTSYRFCGYWTERTLTPTCTYLNRHDNMGGTTQYIQMNTPQLSDDLAMIFLNVPLNRFLYVRSRNISASLPVVGGTYYFHYNFASATTRVINIWFSRHDFTGAPTVTIPVGETIGAIMFTMPIGPLTPDFWTIRFEAGTDYSGAGVFKIGNEYCE